MPDVQPIEGRKVDLGKVSNQPKLPKEPNTPFLLTHSPLSWSPDLVGDEVFWLPVLKPLSIEGGLLGIKGGKNPGDKPDFGPAVDKLKRRRIPRTTLEQRELVKEYLDEYDCRGPDSKVEGLFYTDSWERPSTNSFGAYRSNRDEQGFNRWRLSLVERGYLQPPDEDVVSDYIARFEQHARRVVGLQQNDNTERLGAQHQDLVERARKAKLPERKPEPTARGGKKAA